MLVNIIFDQILPSLFLEVVSANFGRVSCPIDSSFPEFRDASDYDNRGRVPNTCGSSRGHG